MWPTSTPDGTPSNSWTNCCTSSGGSQDAPSRTSISVAGKSSGCTDFNASTFSRKRGSVTDAASAATSFSRTLPERYWSSVSHRLVCGIEKNHAFQVGQKFLYRLVEQTGHVVEVHAAFLIQARRATLPWACRPIRPAAGGESCVRGRWRLWPPAWFPRRNSPAKAAAADRGRRRRRAD